MNKKANMGAVGSIITLIVGVAVAVLVIIFVGALGGQTYNIVQPELDEIGTSASTTNFTANNVTAVSLGQVLIHPGTLTVVNASNTIGLGNFTVNYDAGTIKLVATGANGGLNASSLNASFEYGNRTIQNSINNGILSSFQALEQTGGYLPIIVLAVVIALVLSLILGYVGLNRGMGGFGGGAL
jgi:hypothetical protein